MQTARTCEIIVQGDFMDNKNPFLDFSWEKDMPRNPVSYFFAKPSGQTTFNYQFQNGSIVNYPSIMVEVDPSDKLVFRQPIFSKIEYTATKLTWCNTIDKYLCQYYMLRKRKLGETTCDIELPEKIYEKYKNYAGRGRKNRKVLEVNDAFFIHQKGARKSKTDSSLFRTYEFLKPLYINRLFRSLWTAADADKQKNSLYYDGLQFCYQEVPDFIPKYNVEDYIAHEWLTGISLSIEITSLLLEYGKENINLREKALAEFCKHALPSIVKSPAIFARIAAARNFFHQILVESTVQRFRWSSIAEKKKNDSIWSDWEWEELICRANLHVAGLPVEIDSYVKEDEWNIDVDEALSWLLLLLGKVDLPINIPDYVENPAYGLTAFCNPSHKNVPLFLNLLSERKGEDNTYIAVSNADEEELFRDVHKLVREACKQYTGSFFAQIF